ncbi:MAG: hypothetical protein RJA36_2828 [Pseudomonadota bacterium]|jgi:uroporphyrinogen decarboxylase
MALVSVTPCPPAKTPSAAFWRHQPIADQQALSLAEATLAFHNAVGGDLVKLTPAGTYQAHALGLQDSWESDHLGRRTVTFRPITSPHDWQRLEASLLGQQETHCVQASVWLSARLPAETPLLATVFSPLSQAMQLAGAQQLIAHARKAPEAVLQGLEQLTRRTYHLIQAYAEAGVGGIYYVSQHHLAGALPCSDLQSWGNHADNRVLQATQDLPLNIMHFHGNPLTSELPELPSGWRVHFESANGNPALKEWVSHRPEPLMVGLSINTLHRGADPLFRQATVTQLIEEFPGRELWFGAGCVLPQDFPLALAADWVRTTRFK